MAYDDLLKRIGSRIRQRRKELGITQEELAGSEYTKSFISQVEKGQTWPSLPALAYIAQRLGRPIEWFVAEEIPNPCAARDRAGGWPRARTGAIGSGSGVTKTVGVGVTGWPKQWSTVLAPLKRLSRSTSWNMTS